MELGIGDLPDRLKTIGIVIVVVNQESLENFLILLVWTFAQFVCEL